MTKTKQHKVPIVDFDFEVIVTDDIRREFNRRKKTFKSTIDEDEHFSGLYAYKGRKGAVFFEQKYLTHELIAHEARHAADRMMEFNSQKFGNGCCVETPALIQGYLAKLIYKDLARWGTRIKH